MFLTSYQHRKQLILFSLGGELEKSNNFKIGKKLVSANFKKSLIRK